MGKINKTLSNKGKELIHKFEQFRNKPYLDAVGVATIGWGNTYYANNKEVKLSDKPITQEQGDKLFNLIVYRFEKHVNELVKVDITQNQFDALVSFAYNLGSGSLRESTLLRKLNTGHSIDEVANEFLRWNKGRINGKLKVLRGLTLRRKEEFTLFKST